MTDKLGRLATHATVDLALACYFVAAILFFVRIGTAGSLESGARHLDARLAAVPGPYSGRLSLLSSLEPPPGLVGNRAPHRRVVRLGLGRRAVLQLRLHAGLDRRCALAMAFARQSSPEISLALARLARLLFVYGYQRRHHFRNWPDPLARPDRLHRPALRLGFLAPALRSDIASRGATRRRRHALSTSATCLLGRQGSRESMPPLSKPA